MAVTRRPAVGLPPPAEVVIDLDWDANDGLVLRLVRGTRASDPGDQVVRVPIGIRPSDLVVIERPRVGLGPSQSSLF